MHFYRCRHRCLKLGQGSFDGFHRIDDIGSRLAKDDQLYRRFAVGHAHVEYVLAVDTDMRHLLQPYRYAVKVSHHQFVVLRGELELVVCLYLPALPGIFDRSLGAVVIAGGDSLPDLFQAQPHVVELIQIQIDTHGWQGSAAHVHLADTGDLGDLLRQYGRGGIVKLAERQAF